MDKVIEKLSGYEILNCVIPGAFLALTLNEVFAIDVSLDNIIGTLFIYYIIGLIISRLGSLVVEPLLKKVKFIKFAEYKNYVESLKADDKIAILNQVNNMYRTLIMCILILPFVKLYLIIQQACQLPESTKHIVLLIGIFILFLFAYRKQTTYIRKRVERVIKSENEQEII